MSYFTCNEDIILDCDYDGQIVVCVHERHVISFFAHQLVIRFTFLSDWLIEVLNM